MEIKVGYLAAYDYELLKQSLPTVYAEADKIVLSIDKDRTTFAGEPFTVAPSFFTWLKGFDTDNKISLYEDGFYVPGLNTMEAETCQRNMLAKFMGEGGWHIQVDVDEYFPDFPKLISDLRSWEQKSKGTNLTFRAYWRSIFKITEQGYFLIDGSRENFALATNNPVYERARYNHSNQNVTLNHIVLHQSWGRTPEDLLKKLRNWSHNTDFDTEAYFRFWESINVYNYRYFHNFHPVYPEYWKNLAFIEAGSMEDLLKKTPAQYEEEAKQKTHPAMQKWLPPVIYSRLVKRG